MFIKQFSATYSSTVQKFEKTLNYQACHERLFLFWMEDYNIPLTDTWSLPSQGNQWNNLISFFLPSFEWMCDPHGSEQSYPVIWNQRWKTCQFSGPRTSESPTFNSSFFSSLFLCSFSLCLVVVFRLLMTNSTPWATLRQWCNKGNLQPY